MDSMIKLGAVVLGTLAFFQSAKRAQRSKTPAPTLELPLRGGVEPLKTQSLTKLLTKMSITDVDFEDKKVLMRVDYNVPVKDGVVTDTARIDSTVSSIKYLLDYKGKNGRGIKKLVLIAHSGRPAGNYDRKKLSLYPCIAVLQQRFPETLVKFVDDCVGPQVESQIDSAPRGSIVLLENLRFHIEECGSSLTQDKKKIKAKPEDVQVFCDQLSRLGDVYVFEAFGAAHRPHASVVGLSIPIRVSGMLMQKELSYYGRVLGAEKKGKFLAIIGGAKVSDKIAVIKNMLTLVDELIIGGGMTYTFKKVMKPTMAIGNSLFEEKSMKDVEEVLAEAERRGVKIHLPMDHVIADKFDAAAKIGITDDIKGIPDSWMALDVGPDTVKHNSAVMAGADIILWNGPMGVFEIPAFSNGTLSMMWDMVKASERGVTTIIGGGDTGAASAKFYVGGRTASQQVAHCSTGGGTSLVLMEGKMLPAVEALTDREQ